MAHGYILLVEDDLRLAHELVATLERDGHSVRWLTEGQKALRRFLPGCELVILDLGLPDMSGLSVLRSIRRESDVPVLILTGTSDSAALAHSFELGADDYVAKPFEMSELRWRVRARVKRPSIRPEPLVEIGHLRVNLGNQRAWIDGEELSLTVTEAKLLTMLACNKGEAVARAALERRGLAPTMGRVARALDVHIFNLRRKIGDAASLTTVRGVGYRLEQPQGVTPAE